MKDNKRIQYGQQN